MFDVVLTIDFDDPVVILIGNQDMAVVEQLSAVGIVEFVETIARKTGDAIVPDDFFFPVHFNDALIGLVRNQEMAVRQHGRGDRSIELVGTCARLAAILAVLPHNLTLFIHQDDAVVRAAVDRVRAARQRWIAGWNACAGNQSELAKAFSVIRPDNGARPGNARSIAEVPNDLVVLRIDFNHSVIELVGDDNMSWLVETIFLLSLQRRARSQHDAAQESHKGHASEALEQLIAHDRYFEFRHRPSPLCLVAFLCPIAWSNEYGESEEVNCRDDVCLLSLSCKYPGRVRSY